jgi:hypothetical protein
LKSKNSNIDFLWRDDKESSRKYWGEKKCYDDDILPTKEVDFNTMSLYFQEKINEGGVAL